MCRWTAFASAAGEGTGAGGGNGIGGSADPLKMARAAAGKGAGGRAAIAFALEHKEAGGTELERPDIIAWMCRYGGQQNAARSTQVKEIQEPTLALLLHSAFSSLSHNGYGCCYCWFPVVVCCCCCGRSEHKQ